MKEITAILRPGKGKETKEALAKIGVLTCTTRRVFGRGKQRGLKYTSATGKESVAMRYLPKKMLYLVVNDSQYKVVIQSLIKVNQTGQFGDGKIFVSSMGQVHRIRTQEKGEAAIR